MATITIASTVFPNVNYTGTTFTWRIFSDKSWIAADGTIVPARGDSDTFYKEYAVSVAGTNGTVPQITLLSQTDALNEKNARYSIYWCVDGVLKDMVLANTLGAFQIPDTPASTTWGATERYNFGVSRRYYKDDNTYSALVIDQKIAAVSASTTLATSTLAGLPTAGTAGRERLVTDTDEGVYVDSGTQWYSLTHGIFDFKRFGGVGDGSTSNTTILSSIITAIGSNQGTVIFPYSANPYVVGTVSVPSNVKLDFSAGGQIKVTTGATLAIASPKDDWPTRQLFTNATAGLGTVTFSGAGTVQASWFGNCTTECGAPITAAYASLAAVGGYIQIPAGSLTQTVSVNATGLSTSPIILSGTGAGSGVGTTINCQLTGVGFDCTGSQFLVFRDFVLSGNQMTTPTVGFLFARKPTRASAGENNMIRVKTLGYFSIAPLYNYGSENFLADTSSFTNNKDGGYSAIVTKDNVSSVASAYQTISTFAESSLDIRFTHCRLYNYSTTAIDALLVRGATGFSFTDGFILQNQRAFIHIDASVTGGATNLNFKNVVLDAGGNGPSATYGWLITGTNQVAYLSIENDYDAGTFNTNAGGGFTAITNANPAVITTSSAHGLTSGQTIALTGALSTLGAAINGPRVVTVLSSTTFSIPVNTSALSVYSGTGASGGGRNFYAEPGSNVLEVRINQINGTQGSNAPYLFMYGADHCELDVAPAGTLEVAGNLDPSFTTAAITNSIVRVPPSNFIMARSDLCKYNTIVSRNLGVQIVGILMQGEGAALAISGNTIAPTNSIHQVGAGLIKTITVPTGFTSGTVALVPTAAFTYDATGNVLGTGTATVGRTMMATYSASTSKWSMSY